eukprot:CAMPEP_0168736900 /NCGR_PEP_ID=MMETSP0724-20121128/10103_1 /TAXON_ID=265536 /ORGANISM="Amphiprora sp., Strain CCMP467" /LENGTH=608 /DNA_ID=CAMNT_0008784121 /DNA_START=84 /DNA_END=1910 /DNA_ORIENTATION=+
MATMTTTPAMTGNRSKPTIAALVAVLALTVDHCQAFLSSSTSTRHFPSSCAATRLHVVGGATSYLDSLGTPLPEDDGSSEFLVGILGDLHIDPRKMEDYIIGREHWQNLFSQTADSVKTALVSLGDLGESKSVRPKETRELFAGTTECHMLAAEYLNSIGPPYEVVGGNHDLEGIDEFATDEENLELFLRAHNKPWPQFLRKITDKTLLVGLTSTVFRDAKYTSHEVVIDPEQIAWFENVVKSHPASEGYKIIVFTHAPPNGSGLRVLQENHVVNGCCWLNHSDEQQCRKFIELVREHRCIKAWFSGHFHLGQDYQDSITFPTIPKELGPYPNRGSCVFAQTSVMRTGTSRDGRRQSRVIRGNDDGFEICTLDHANGGALRVDASIVYTDCNHEVGIYTHDDISRQGDQFFKVYAPCAGDDYHPPDENLVRYNENGLLHIDTPITKESKAWWYLACGRVLGLLNGMMIEYDRSTLAPLGLVVGPDELLGKTIAVVDSGISEEECMIVAEEVGMEGADCSGELEAREQAVMLVGQDGSVVVVQPNEDGSYWRKIVRNKMIREKEKRRELAAKSFAPRDAHVVSSWGPYTSTAGTAKRTGVSGLTAPALR